MKYVICDNCGCKNPVISERLVFCSQCEKKLTNNYIDWKKNKANALFENYMNDVTTEDENPFPIKTPEVKKKENLFLKPLFFFTSIPPHVAEFLTSARLMQLTSLIILVTLQALFVIYPDNTPDKNYLCKTQWKNYSITSDLSLTLPFELKKSQSVLPYYLENYVITESKKSESIKSFSVTIEEINNDRYNAYILKDLLNVDDEYAANKNAYFTSLENLEHIPIKPYQAYSQHGSYMLDGNEYLYENYTLMKDDKAFKIIISYLKDDDLLCNYAEIVSKSLFKNNKTI